MRWIDEIIKAVEDHPHISTTHKQVLKSRIEQPPTQSEIEEANSMLRWGGEDRPK